MRGYYRHVPRGPLSQSLLLVALAVASMPARQARAGEVTRVGLADVGAGEGAARSITALRARLVVRPGIALPRDAARAALEDPLPDDAEATAGDVAFRSRAAQLLRAARDSYSRFDYDGALDRLRQADLALVTASPSSELTQLLIDITLLAGVIEADRGNTPRALDAFRLARRLDPARKALDPGSYRPRVVTLYAQAGAPVPDPRRSRISVVTDPAGASVWIDGRPAGAAPIELVLDVGFHYVAAVAEGSTPRLEKPLLRAGQDTRLPLMLARQPPEERARAARAEMRGGRTSFTRGAGILAVSASLDLVILVRGGRDAGPEAAIYDAHAGTLGPWMPAEPAPPVLAALTLKETPAPSSGGPTSLVAQDAGTRRSSPPAATPWYRTWWIVPPLLAVGAAATLGTLWIIDRERTTTYSINRWCFDRTCSP
jgi:PEGA domain